jgi:hypothetical protein
MRNYREEIEAALAGGSPEYMPFTFYKHIIPEVFDTSSLQAKGMAICLRRDVYRKSLPNVKTTVVKQQDRGIRTVYETPIGALTMLSRPAAVGMAMVEHPIKTRDDYRIAKFIAGDARYEPDYEAFVAEQRTLGDSGKVVAGYGADEPLMEIQVQWVGQEQFCYELADNEDALMELHEALVENQRQLFDVTAASPADYVLYGGNIVPDMLGPSRVRDLIRPCWNAFADKLHEKGKKIGCHLDANNRLILDIVRDSQLDFIEAFTPPPDCNISVAEARSAWPGKALWINFPSSVHLQSEERIRQTTLDIVKQAGDRKGFLMGVTEDIPREHIARSVSVILETLQSCRRV